MKIIEKRPNTGKKTVCLSRYGAYGDAIWLSPVFEKLQQDGHYVIFNCTERCFDIQKRNPNIDCFWLQETDEVQNEQLGPHWEALAKKVDKFINLSGSVEGVLLKTPQDPLYNASKAERHAVCDVNYQDRTMALAGYPEEKGKRPTLHFSPSEEEWAKAFREKHKGFLVVVGLTGSSFHKTYPYMDAAIHAILEGLPEAIVVGVGEAGVSGIIEPHPRYVDMCGKTKIRKSLILTKIADVVISPETAVANGASCFDTPKIILLSHSSVENLTKYWTNCHSIEPPVSCFPCHKLHYEAASCPRDENLQMPICVSLLHPKLILEKVETVYDRWKSAQLLRSK